jgi:hypothetical protein
MKCPHCSTDFHEDWHTHSFVWRSRAEIRTELGAWQHRETACSKCKDVVIEIARFDGRGFAIEDWRMVYPVGANRGPVPTEVPHDIASDYVEACNVLPISPKASAALSRRCLQNMLHEEGYRGHDLNAEIGLLLKEPDPTRAIPRRLRDTIDAIRNFGNFSAHPIDDKTALQIIDVEPHEAEWCLEILEESFEHFYVGPAIAKARKADLDAKLAAAGKPPSK